MNFCAECPRIKVPYLESPKHLDSFFLKVPFIKSNLTYVIIYPNVQSVDKDHLSILRYLSDEK